MDELAQQLGSTNKNLKIVELINLNEDLENYFRNTLIPQLFIDADLILRKFTPPAMKQFNLSSDDVGKHIEQIADNIRFPNIVSNIQQVIDNGADITKEIQTTDLRWFQMNIIPYIVYKSNQTNGVILTFVDITSRIRDLRDMENLVAEGKTMVAMFSHDIRTPLTSLMLAIELFKELNQGENEESQSLLKIIQNSINNITGILTEITTISQNYISSSGEAELLNIEHLLEDVRLTLKNIIIKSGTTIHTELEVSEILAPRRKLRSILFNLLNNAIKFTSPDCAPLIAISTKRENGFIIICVKDNGIGIDEKDHKNIFLKNFRVQNAIDGTGVGLYLISEFVTDMDGKISVESTLGKGSEFKIYLNENLS